MSVFTEGQWKKARGGRGLGHRLKFLLGWFEYESSRSQNSGPFQDKLSRIYNKYWVQQILSEATYLWL